MGEVTEVRAPVENVNDETIAIIRWMVGNGSRVEQGASLVLAETTKTSIDIEAPASGFVWQVAAAGTDVATGSVLCYIGEELEQVKAAAASSQSSPGVGSDSAGRPREPRTEKPQPGEGTPPRFSARAMALLRELAVDPAVFSGKGLVREQDVLAYVGPRDKPVQPAQSGTVLPTSPPPLHAAAGVTTKVEPLSRIKRYEASLLRAASSATLPSAVTVAVPTGGFFSAQKHSNLPGLASAAVIYEVSRLLRTYTMFNAYCSGNDIHYYERVNIGYALDLDKGLKVPVIHDADRKTLQEIAEKKQQLLVDYLNDSLSLESLAGGTFTITDLSAEGVVSFQPVINAGQAAILGICAESFAPGATKGTFNLVLAFDHQMAEGRRAATFLRDLRERLVAHEASLGQMAPPAPEPHCAFCLRPVSELEENRHFLVRLVTRPGETEKAVCTICLEDW